MQIIIDTRQKSSHEGIISNPRFAHISGLLILKEYSDRLSKPLSETETTIINKVFLKAKKQFFMDIQIHKENVYKISKCILCILIPALRNVITEEIRTNHNQAIKEIENKFPNLR